MNLKSTWFTNPHGLSDPGSYSTAADVGKMAAHSMKDPLLKEIVSRIQYKCMAQTKEGFEREYVWDNTNTLLKETELSSLVPRTSPLQYPSALLSSLAPLHVSRQAIPSLRSTYSMG